MWTWIVGGLVVWVLVALFLGVVIGRGIRLADDRARGNDIVLDLLDAAPARVRQVRQRRVVPLPPVGVGLAAAAVALETMAYVVRLIGTTGPAARLLSMDGVHSLPRMYVAGLFGTAAVAALAGAARMPGRRAWWLGVGLVTAGIAAVKIGSTVHVQALGELRRSVGPVTALVVSALLAIGVIAVLGLLSRSERRDRRRVLAGLAGYAFAAVGLSTVSTMVSGRWGAAVTFVEESGEALAGVAVLVAVLVGVAPRLVLPASWPLRRQADAHTVEVGQRVPGIADR